MTKDNPILNAAAEIVETLKDLSSDDRKKAISAALLVLGDSPLSRSQSSDASGTESGDGSGAQMGHAKGVHWMKKHKIDTKDIEKYFHYDGKACVVIGLPDTVKSKPEITRVSYLFAGVASLLSTGESNFTDKEARDKVVEFGGYDQANHASYLARLKNQITGNKTAGWKITTPGLDAAAGIIMQKAEKQ